MFVSHILRAVLVYALNSKPLLLSIQEPRRARTFWKPEPGNQRYDDCQSALNDEQILPVVQARAGEVEDAVC